MAYNLNVEVDTWSISSFNLKLIKEQITTVDRWRTEQDFVLK